MDGRLLRSRARAAAVGAWRGALRSLLRSLLVAIAGAGVVLIRAVLDALAGTHLELGTDDGVVFARLHELTAGCRFVAVGAAVLQVEDALRKLLEALLHVGDALLDALALLVAGAAL